MALTVGELNAIVTIDDRTVDPGLRRVENAMRQAGQHMSDDADRAGQRAGQGLADGVSRGLRDVRTDAERAGRQAGDALGDGMADSGEQGADTAVGGITDRLSALKGAAIGVGLAAGAALMSAFSDAMEQGKITARLGAQLGATGPEARRYGHIAGQLYANAVTEDFQGAADAIRAVASSGLVPPHATNAQIKSIATNAADLASLFEVDVSQAAQAAGSAVKNGLAKDSKQAFDLLTKGMQGLGPASEDLLETFTEYGPIFQSAGLSGQTALGLIRQAIQGGWTKDTDKIADAFKEFQIRGTEGSKAVQDAYKKLGLDAKQTGDDIAAGGKRGERAMDAVLDRLRELGVNSQDAKQIVSTLFGGPGEDLGAALFALDVDKAGKSMGDFAGAADKAGNALRDNAGTRVEQFKRGLQQGVVNFLGGTVIPALDKVKKGLGTMWDDAGKGGTEGVDRIIAFFGILGQRLADKVVELAPKAIEALSGLGQKIANYIIANPEQVLKIGAIAGAIALAFAALPALIAGAILSAANTIIIGFVRRMITALAEKLPLWWNSFVLWVGEKATQAAGVFNIVGAAIGRWFGGLWARYIAGPVSRQWTSFITTVQALPGRAAAALATLAGALRSKAIEAGQALVSASQKKISDAVAAVRTLPGRARSALGNLGNYLAAAGRSLIQGFIDGIKAKIGEVRSAASSVLSAARQYFPFSPAKKGPFSGRGYTTYSGAALIDGFVKGIERAAPGVGSALNGMSGMAAAQLAGLPIADTALTSLTPTAATSAKGTPSRQSTPVVTLRSDGSAYGEFLIGELRRAIGTRGGDVQFVLGK